MRFRSFRSRIAVSYALLIAVALFGITAIIGPSGSGKSTFLRCLNRVHK